MSGLLGNLKSAPVNLTIPLNTGFTSMILFQCNLEWFLLIWKKKQTYILQVYIYNSSKKQSY